MRGYWILILYSLFLWGASLQTFAQEGGGAMPQDRIIFYFKADSSRLSRTHATNAATMRHLRMLWSDSLHDAPIDSILIVACTSPEGHQDRNRALALGRASAIRDYLRSLTTLSSDRMRILLTPSTWREVAQLAAVDPKNPYRIATLAQLEPGVNESTLEWRLRHRLSPQQWRYIAEHYLPKLRTGEVYMQWSPSPQGVGSRTLSLQSLGSAPISTPGSLHCATSSASVTYQRPLALKTNLLFDLATLINIELEVPLAPRWSVCGEYLFPWWLNRHTQNCVQIIAGSVELRYWLKPDLSRQAPQLRNHNPLTGWFVGVYGGGGYYDLEWHKKGYQGEFFVNSGISGGYVKSIGRNLALEFSLGLGYLKTRYRKYHAQLNTFGRYDLIRERYGDYRWIGPTKAKIALSWYPHLKSRKK